MVVLLRGCILAHKMLFVREITQLKRIFTYCSSNSVKNFTPLLQKRYFSDKDDERKERKLVYVGILHSNIRNIKIAAFLTSAISLLSQPVLYTKLIEDGNEQNLAIPFITLNLVAIASPLMIHLIAKKYVVEIYYCSTEKNYTAVVYSFLLKKKEITFTPDDVVECHSKFALLPCCYIKGHPLFFAEDLFISSEHYYIIMGYKKLEDFEVDDLKVPSLNKVPIIESSHQIESGKEQQK